MYVYQYIYILYFKIALCLYMGCRNCTVISSKGNGLIFFYLFEACFYAIDQSYMLYKHSQELSPLNYSIISKIWE